MKIGVVVSLAIWAALAPAAQADIPLHKAHDATRAWAEWSIRDDFISGYRIVGCQRRHHGRAGCRLRQRLAEPFLGTSLCDGWLLVRGGWVRNPDSDLRWHAVVVTPDDQHITRCA